MEKNILNIFHRVFNKQKGLHFLLVLTDDRMFVALFTAGLFVVCSASCPHERQGLKRWSETSTWNAPNKVCSMNNILVKFRIE